MVYVILLIDNDFDMFVGGVASSEEIAEEQAEILMEYDESIQSYIIQPESILDQVEI